MIWSFLPRALFGEQDAAMVYLFRAHSSTRQTPRTVCPAPDLRQWLDCGLFRPHCSRCRCPVFASRRDTRWRCRVKFSAVAMILLRTWLIQVTLWHAMVVQLIHQNSAADNCWNRTCTASIWMFWNLNHEPETRRIGWQKNQIKCIIIIASVSVFFNIEMGRKIKKNDENDTKNVSNTHLNELNVTSVTFPAQKARQSFGMPRAMQHGVWLMLFTRHLNEILAHGAHTIKSAISLKSAFFGSHIRSRHVEWVIPCFTQQPRTSITSTAAAKIKQQKIHERRQENEEENRHLQSITEINFTTSARVCVSFWCGRMQLTYQ